MSSCNADECDKSVLIPYVTYSTHEKLQKFPLLGPSFPLREIPWQLPGIQRIEPTLSPVLAAGTSQRRMNLTPASKLARQSSVKFWPMTAFWASVRSIRGCCTDSVAPETHTAAAPPVGGLAGQHVGLITSDKPSFWTSEIRTGEGVYYSTFHNLSCLLLLYYGIHYGRAGRLQRLAELCIKKLAATLTR